MYMLYFMYLYMYISYTYPSTYAHPTLLGHRPKVASMWRHWHHPHRLLPGSRPVRRGRDASRQLPRLLFRCSFSGALELLEYRASRDHISIRILQNMISGISFILGPRTRRSLCLCGLLGPYLKGVGAALKAVWGFVWVDLRQVWSSNDHLGYMSYGHSFC